MSAETYPLYDFLAASQVERPLSNGLKNWMAKFNKLFPERWVDNFSTSISSTSMSIQSHNFDEARSKWLRPSLGVPFSISPDNAQKSVSGLIVAERVDLRLLILDILGEIPEAKPEDQELTTVELSMSSMIFEAIAATFGEAWPAKETMPISCGSFDEKPDNSRLFPPKKEVIVTGFEIKSSKGAKAGPARFQWIFAKEELINLMDVPTTAKIVPDGSAVDPEVIRQIDLSLIACLGSTELSMADLVCLREGVIVKLNQPIDQPLLVTANGLPLIKGWPGQAAGTQNLLVDSLILKNQ